VNLGLRGGAALVRGGGRRVSSEGRGTEENMEANSKSVGRVVVVALFER
jgi:hypothetical protein